MALAQISRYLPHFAPTPQIAAPLERVRAKLAASPFADRLDELMARVEPYVALRILKDRAKEQLQLGASRFGYVPDLPPGMEWPTLEGKKYGFLAQLDLSEFPYWEGSPLPKDGWLYAFASVQDLPWPYAIMHHRGPREALVRAAKPRSMSEMLPDVNQEPCFRLVAIEPEVAVDIDPQLLQDVMDDRQRLDLRDRLDTLLPFSNDSYADVGYAGHLLGQAGDFENETATESVNQLIEVGLHPVPGPEAVSAAARIPVRGVRGGGRAAGTY